LSIFEHLPRDQNGRDSTVRVKSPLDRSFPLSFFSIFFSSARPARSRRKSGDTAKWKVEHPWHAKGRERKKKKKGRTCLKKVDPRCRGVHRESGQVYRIARNGFDFIVESVSFFSREEADGHDAEFNFYSRLETSTGSRLVQDAFISLLHSIVITSSWTAKSRSHMFYRANCFGT